MRRSKTELEVLRLLDQLQEHRGMLFKLSLRSKTSQSFIYLWRRNRVSDIGHRRLLRIRQQAIKLMREIHEQSAG